jgi:UDP-glucose 4-epimerase
VRILITGITGTLGRWVSDILLGSGHEIIGYSRDEQKQRLIPNYDKLTLYLGDVRDRDRITEASRGCQIIFHLAALKCVDTLEANPDESIKTNLVGTDNILHAQRVNNISRVVFTSTDKAVYPINSYGKSKALAEDLVLRNKNNVVCRYGNVLASRGSVLPIFVEKIRNNHPVEITDPRMTRFWMTQAEAADFVISRGLSDMACGLNVPEIQSSSLVTLALTIGEALGKQVEMKTIGIRPGEKLHEQLRTEEEGGLIRSNDRSYFFSKNELYRKIKDFIK